MIITVNCDTRPEELYHLSVLFRSLAKAHGFKAPVETPASASQTSTVGELSVTLNVDTSDATSAVEALADLIDRTGVKVEDVSPVTIESVTSDINAKYDTLVEAGIIDPADAAHVTIQCENDNLDSAGLPWDARIHAGSRERNTDGSWRVRRKPKDTDQEEWSATLARVTSELRDLMEIPVTPGAVADAAAEDALTDAEIDQFVDIVQGVTEPVAIVPPPVVAPPAIEHGVTHHTGTVDTDTGEITITPPVTAVAPPIVTVSPAIETFAQVMTWLTARTPKDEAEKPAMVAKVNEILAANGLTVLTQLGQRPDLIPQIMTQFNEAFGE